MNLPQIYDLMTKESICTFEFDTSYYRYNISYLKVCHNLLDSIPSSHFEIEVVLQDPYDETKQRSLTSFFSTVDTPLFDLISVQIYKALRRASKFLLVRDSMSFEELGDFIYSIIKEDLEEKDYSYRSGFSEDKPYKELCDKIVTELLSEKYENEKNIVFKLFYQYGLGLYLPVPILDRFLDKYPFLLGLTGHRYLKLYTDYIYRNQHLLNTIVGHEFIKKGRLHPKYKYVQESLTLPNYLALIHYYGRPSSLDTDLEKIYFCSWNYSNNQEKSFDNELRINFYYDATHFGKIARNSLLTEPNIYKDYISRVNNLEKEGERVNKGLFNLDLWDIDEKYRFKNTKAYLNEHKDIYNLLLLGQDTARIISTTEIPKELFPLFENKLINLQINE